MEGTLTTYSVLLHYSLETHATDNEIVQTEAKIMSITQSRSRASVEYAELI